MSAKISLGVDGIMSVNLGLRCLRLSLRHDKVTFPTCKILKESELFKFSKMLKFDGRTDNLAVRDSHVKYMKFIILSQRDEKTKYGSEVYLWYLGTDKSCRFSTASDFHARNNVCFMYNESQRKYEC